MRKIIPLSIAAICLASSGMVLAQTPPACKTFNTTISGNISAVTTISENMGLSVNVTIMCTSTNKAIFPNTSINPVFPSPVSVGKLSCGKTVINDGVITLTSGSLGAGKLTFSGKLSTSTNPLSKKIASWSDDVCQ